MTTYYCVSNRDINCFINVILSNLNTNNFSIIIFYKYLIVYILTSVFQSFFCFTTPFLFLLPLLFQFSFLICRYSIGRHNPKEEIITLRKKTIVSGIRWIEKTFLNQILFFQLDLKKKNQRRFEYLINFRKNTFIKKPTGTLLTIY